MPIYGHFQNILLHGNSRGQVGPCSPLSSGGGGGGGDFNFNPLKDNPEEGKVDADGFSSDSPSLLHHPIRPATRYTRHLAGQFDPQAFRTLFPQVASTADVDPLSFDAKFTASAAKTPIRCTSTKMKLKSCLSASSRSGVMIQHRTRNGNAQIKMSPKVSFSQERVREYEVTLGDNPSVLSGPPVSLGWRYNPNEKIFNLDLPTEHINSQGSISSRSTEYDLPQQSRKRSTKKLRIPEKERRRSLMLNPNVRPEDILNVLHTNDMIRLERKESLVQLIREKRSFK